MRVRGSTKFGMGSPRSAQTCTLCHTGRLHSSTLDSLGLVAGVKAFCKEFAEQQEIQVDFADENVPSGVPGDVALCLFRIVQEGLRNIKRHSGADEAGVRLERLGKTLHLFVTDQGRGFDTQKRSAAGGMGFIEERSRDGIGVTAPASGLRLGEGAFCRPYTPPRVDQLGSKLARNTSPRRC